MTKVKQFIAAGLALFAVVGVTASADAAAIDILWYTGGVQDTATAGAQYRNAFNSLAATNPGGNSWSITYWDSGAAPAPGLGSTGGFEVLVVTSATGGWDTFPTYGALTSAGYTEASFGNRVMVTGQDTDWHYLNGPGDGTTGQAFNGPRGFLENAVNWAGSGTGLGAVVMNAPAFFGTFSGLGTDTGGTNNVIIPGAFAGLPINAGLTSAGLSNWNTSSHHSWTGTDTTKWATINQNGDNTSQYVTLIKAVEASGGTTPAVPAPLSLMMLGLGFGTAAVAKRLRA